MSISFDRAWYRGFRRNESTSFELKILHNFSHVYARIMLIYVICAHFDVCCYLTSQIRRLPTSSLLRVIPRECLPAMPR